MKLASDRPAETNALVVESDPLGRVFFYVEIHQGDWHSQRIVTVTDPTIDVTDLMRRILNHDTNVTEFDRSSGEVVQFENGRRFIVAEWGTNMVVHPCGLSDVQVEVSVITSDGDDRKIEEDELPGLKLSPAINHG